MPKSGKKRDIIPLVVNTDSEPRQNLQKPTAKEKLRLNYTLSDYEERLFRKAIKIAFGDSHYRGMWKQDKQRMISFALLAFCRGVINGGYPLGRPPVAELRRESPEETRDRVNDRIRRVLFVLQPETNN